MSTLDLAELRSVMRRLRDELHSGSPDLTDLRGDVDRVLAILDEPRNMHVDHGGVDRGPLEEALRAAIDALDAGGVPRPAVVLVVQSHLEDGTVAGRTLAANLANPRDLLHITLRNLQKAGA